MDPNKIHAAQAETCASACQSIGLDTSDGQAERKWGLGGCRSCWGCVGEIPLFYNFIL